MINFGNYVVYLSAQLSLQVGNHEFWSCDSGYSFYMSFSVLPNICVCAVCVHVCVGACVCVCMCMHVCTCMCAVTVSVHEYM